MEEVNNTCIFNLRNVNLSKDKKEARIYGHCSFYGCKTFVLMLDNLCTQGDDVHVTVLS